MITPPQSRFLDRLLRAVPQLNELFAEHRTEYSDPIPMLFMAALSRWAANAFLKEDPDLQPLLDTLEQEFAAGDEEIRDLIAVGFVESLPNSAQPGGEIRLLLGPLLFGEYQRLNW